VQAHYWKLIGKCVKLLQCVHVMIHKEGAYRCVQYVVEFPWLFLATLLRKSVTPDGDYRDEPTLSSKNSASFPFDFEKSTGKLL